MIEKMSVSRYNRDEKKGADLMKWILKLFALPVLLIVKIICMIGNLLTNLSSWVLGAFFLVIASCAVYCIVQTQWTNLAILAGMAAVAFVILFVWIWLLVKAETLCECLSNFIHS